ncbi:MAG TPA: NAD(P)H-dependent glycerol-3-phosphate dehydrogenase [Bacilli bacterium]|nr:NAD(P)H-dependent glycerol-3-phosphate dehydrogenase [Bacilli bacterium]
MRIAIIGSGAWATALAQVLVDNGHRVMIYGVETSQVDDISLNHRNSAYFKEIVINQKIQATTDLALALSKAKAIVLAVPSVAMESVVKQINALLTRKVMLINVSKGFGSHNQRMSDVIRDGIDETKRFPLVSLIGPSHAEEVILRHLTVLSATSISRAYARKVAQMFSCDYFRVYIQTDEIGAEIGVAMKNAIAIASGIIEGLGLGDNARAALVTRGLAEMTSFGRHYGGKLKTYLGLTGLGDLIVTCYSFHSRNFKAGLAIGKDDSAASFLATNKTTVEGIRSAKTVYELAKQANIQVPIVTSVYRVLYQGARPSDMVAEMMARPLKEE